MTTITTYYASAPYMLVNRKNVEGMAQADAINKSAGDQGYITEREWFEREITCLGENAWQVSISEVQVEVDEE